MAQKKPYNDNFADLVARLNAMSNMTPDQERAEYMEAASAAVTYTHLTLPTSDLV